MTESTTRGRARFGQVRHGRLTHKNPIAAFFKIVGIALAVVLISTTSVAAIAAHDVLSSKKPTVHLAQLPGHTSTPLPSAPAGQTVGEVNMLVIGTDTRSGQGVYANKGDIAASSGAGNNDVNILLHISSDHKSISVISIPRDLEVPMPACPNASGGTTSASSKDMINTALERGGNDQLGLQCAVLAVEKLTGVNIPYAASVTFEGTAAISTAVGGVTVCLATPVIDRNVIPVLNLKAGETSLVGAQALAFLRSRHGVGDGSDLGRISNQQVFMSALARQLVSSDTLTNPFKLYAIAKAAVSNSVTSDTLASPTSLLGILQAVKTVGLSNMVFLQYPTGADPVNANRVVPNAYAAQQLNSALQNDLPIQLTGGTGVGAEAPTGSTATPSATTAPTTPSSTATTPATTTPATTAPTTGSGATSTVTLPPTVTGQTAAEQTCTKGNN
ncbi:LCP family protein [Frondihabitans cladoniiphilus]|uniref:LCP family protein n=1 Tax=Frondihabitans cladoniiphilus TaxID=715785 RepID=A0ABP8W4S8_9MICO